MDTTVLGQDGCRYIKSDNRGYCEGTGWDDGAVGQVRNIAIFYGDVVHSIQTTYQHGNSMVMSRMHGGNVGNLEMINFNEPLTWVTGYYGLECLDPELFFVGKEEDPGNFQKIIKSLKFGTDRASYGPFGREVGEPFSFRATTGIGGFHGRSSSQNLHAIGVYVRCLATRFLDDPPMPDLKLELPETSSFSSFSSASKSP